MLAEYRMRRWIRIALIVGSCTVSGTDVVQAQFPDINSSSLNNLGRRWGIGYSNGYHQCATMAPSRGCMGPTFAGCSACNNTGVCGGNPCSACAPGISSYGYGFGFKAPFLERVNPFRYFDGIEDPPAGPVGCSGCMSGTCGSHGPIGHIPWDGSYLPASPSYLPAPLIPPGATFEHASPQPTLAPTPAPTPAAPQSPYTTPAPNLQPTPRQLPPHNEQVSPYPSPSDRQSPYNDNRLRRNDDAEELPPKRALPPSRNRNDDSLLENDSSPLDNDPALSDQPPPLRRPRKSDKPLGNDYDPPEPMDGGSLLDDEPIELTPKSRWPDPPGMDRDESSLLDDPMEPAPLRKELPPMNDEDNLLDDSDSPASSASDGLSPVTNRTRKSRPTPVSQKSMSSETAHRSSQQPTISRQREAEIREEAKRNAYERRRIYEEALRREYDQAMYERAARSLSYPPSYPSGTYQVPPAGYGPAIPAVPRTAQGYANPPLPNGRYR